jgi:uncharacterized protein
MLYALHAVFKPGAEPTAALNVEFTTHLMQPVLLIHLAGPLFDDRGAQAGWFMIIHASDEASVGHFVSSSPYAIAGLYESVSINRFEPEVGRI